MDLYQTVLETIDMRSFSSLWYWIALGGVWSLVNHSTLGVPFDMIGRAQRRGGRARDDLEALVRVNVGRRLRFARVSGTWLIALGSMILTALGLLGFLYGVEFAQASFLIAFPVSVVTGLAFSTARRIEAEGLRDVALCRALMRLRFWTQAIGLISIFLTAMWGMLQALALGPLI